MAISPDSRMVASGDGVGQVRLVDRRTGAELARLRLDQNERLYPRLFGADGSLLYVWGQQSGALLVWDLRLLRERLTELDLDWDLPPLPALLPRPRAPRSVLFEVGAANHNSNGQRYQHESQYELAVAAWKKSLEMDPQLRI